MSGHCDADQCARLKAQELLELCSDDSLDFESPEEYLLHFSRTGRDELLHKLLQLASSKAINLNINFRGQSKANYGWSALHLAAYFGHDKVVDLLIKNGADVNIQNEEGDSPLHKAAYTGREDIVIYLVTKNANVFLINGDGHRAYEVAKTEVIRRVLLAAEKSEIKRREDRFLSAARSGNVAILRQLLEDVANPVNIDCVDDSGNTALHNAAYRGQNEAVVFLLKHGIDTTLKNNRDQLAANVALTISLKQLIQEVHLSVVTPQTIATLKNRTVSRFEGELFKKGRFFGWKLVWAVMERGVFMFFANRADAAAGIRRKGYKYLESAIPETVSNNDGQLMFLIIFGDRSKAMFCLPKYQTQIDLQKWLNAINDHIYFGTNFIKQGTRIDDSDDEDETTKLLPLSTVQDMISTAGAHKKILERHINAFQQLLDDPSFFAQSRNHCDEAIIPLDGNRTDVESTSIVPTIKFHLNLILESSRNVDSSLSQCLTVIAQQNEVRQAAICQEQEKVRVLEEALQVLAREHHDLERSITVQSLHTAGANMGDASLRAGRNDFLAREHSVSCLSTNTLDEFYDAFDDLDDDEGGAVDDLENRTSTPIGQLEPSNNLEMMVDGMPFSRVNNSTTLNTFHTARDETIDEDISNLEEDDDDKTIGEELDALDTFRERLPASMVPRDEVGLWTILKNCRGKDLSKITFPVVFNEPLSFLQRMAEVFQYAEYLNIADQCDNTVERMENVCAFIVSAYSSNHMRLNKPFNPLLGETFEFEIASSQTRVVFEQVCHHPPISAWHAESPHFAFHGTINPKLRFWGKSIEVKPDGNLTLTLKKTNEVYTWKSINCCVHNIIVGTKWFEQYGTIEVINRANNHKIALNFKPAGWFSHNLNRFDGFIVDDQGHKLRFLYGKWTDYMKTASMESYERYLKHNNHKFRPPDKPVEAKNGSASKVLSKINNFKRQITGSSFDMSDDLSGQTPPLETSSGEVPKSDSSHSLDIADSRIIWKVLPRPAHSAEFYHFNSFTFGLNELARDTNALNQLPKTDSRFRPDIRKLEEGDLDGASFHKNRLEEKQRETRLLRKKGKNQEWEPLWFKQEKNVYTSEMDWLFNGHYWQRDWSKCPDIF